MENLCLLERMQLFKGFLHHSACTILLSNDAIALVFGLFFFFSLMLPKIPSFWRRNGNFILGSCQQSLFQTHLMESYTKLQSSNIVQGPCFFSYTLRILYKKHWKGFSLRFLKNIMIWASNVSLKIGHFRPISLNKIIKVCHSSRQVS